MFGSKRKTLKEKKEEGRKRTEKEMDECFREGKKNPPGRSREIFGEGKKSKETYIPVYFQVLAFIYTELCEFVFVRKKCLLIVEGVILVIANMRNC